MIKLLEWAAFWAGAWLMLLVTIAALVSVSAWLMDWVLTRLLSSYDMWEAWAEVVARKAREKLRG